MINTSKNMKTYSTKKVRDLTLNDEVVDPNELRNIDNVLNLLSDVYVNIDNDDVTSLIDILCLIINRLGGKCTVDRNLNCVTLIIDVSLNLLNNSLLFNIILKPMSFSNKYKIEVVDPTGNMTTYNYLYSVDELIFKIPGRYIIRLYNFIGLNDIATQLEFLRKVFKTNEFNELSDCFIASSKKEFYDLFPYVYFNTDESPTKTNLNEILLLGFKYEVSDIEFILVPNTISEISEYFVSNCESLLNIYFVDDCQLTSIGYDAFKDCVSLTSLILPEGITHIGDSAFLNCVKLEHLELPSSLQFIGDFAFNEIPNTCKITVRNLNNAENTTIDDIRNNLRLLYPMIVDEYTDEDYERLCESMKSEDFQKLYNETVLTIVDNNGYMIEDNDKLIFEGE